MRAEHWLDQPEDHDFPAAESYLSLHFDPADAAKIAADLREVSTSATYQAKDILRASGLPLLTAENTHVAADLRKVRSGKNLSPILLVRGEPLLIADGYHRVCASYHLDENADIPCRIVGRV